MRICEWPLTLQFQIKYVNCKCRVGEGLVKYEHLWTEGVKDLTFLLFQHVLQTCWCNWWMMPKYKLEIVIHLAQFEPQSIICAWTKAYICLVVMARLFTWPIHQPTWDAEAGPVTSAWAEAGRCKHRAQLTLKLRSYYRGKEEWPWQQRRNEMQKLAQALEWSKVRRQRRSHSWTLELLKFYSAHKSNQWQKQHMFRTMHHCDCNLVYFLALSQQDKLSQLLCFLQLHTFKLHSKTTR